MLSKTSFAKFELIYCTRGTAQKMKFSIKDFFSKILHGKLNFLFSGGPVFNLKPKTGPTCVSFGQYH